MPKTSGDTGRGRGRAPVRSTPGKRSQAPGRESVQVKKMPRKPGRFLIKVKKEAWQASGLLKRRRQAERQECLQEPLNFAPLSCALKTKTKPIAIKATQRLFHKCVEL